MHIVEHKNNRVTFSKGNTLNTYISKIVDIAQKLRHYATNREGKYEYSTALYINGYAIQSARQLPFSMNYVIECHIFDFNQQQTRDKENTTG